jgi:hypothetical protein
VDAGWESVRGHGEELRDVDRLGVQPRARRLEVGEIQQLLDEGGQRCGSIVDRVEELRPRVVVQVLPRSFEREAHALDRGQRRAELVRHRREELGLQSIEAIHALDTPPLQLEPLRVLQP